MQTRTILSRGPIQAVVVPPGSKSITNRALILAALSDGETVLDGALDCEDTRLMLDALGQLGLQITNGMSNGMSIVGCRGAFRNSGEIYIGNSGTTARFLTAVLAFSEGDYRIHGKPRMHLRPIGDLLDALAELGAKTYCENNDRCPPVRIAGIRHGIGGRLNLAVPRIATVSGAVSSQFLSALLMAAPLASRGGDVSIAVTGNLVSKPYVSMTLEMMNIFGVQPEISEDFSRFRFSRNAAQEACYSSPGHYRIEPDASAASYFFAAAAVCGGTVTVPGLSRRSLQGDVEFAGMLEKMGCTVRWESDSISVSRGPGTPLRGVTVDMNACSDTAQTLAVVALFAEEPTEILNIEHARHKETDRISDLAVELRRFGAVVEERQDGLKIVPPSVSSSLLQPATVKTYDDHRMAMSFAVAGLRVPGVVIEDPDCVQKTFPKFFEQLEDI